MTAQEFETCERLLLEISVKFAESEKLEDSEAKDKLYAEIEELQMQVMILKL